MLGGTDHRAFTRRDAVHRLNTLGKHARRMLIRSQGREYRVLRSQGFYRHRPARCHYPGITAHARKPPRPGARKVVPRVDAPVRAHPLEEAPHRGAALGRIAVEVDGPQVRQLRQGREVRHYGVLVREGLERGARRRGRALLGALRRGEPEVAVEEARYLFRARRIHPRGETRDGVAVVALHRGHLCGGGAQPRNVHGVAPRLDAGERLRGGALHVLPDEPEVLAPPQDAPETRGEARRRHRVAGVVAA